MKTAVTYLRVSSAEQIGNTSLDDQDERTRKHIMDKGWKHLKTFREEGKSAKDDDRPVLKKLLQFCAENEVDFVVSLDMSRLSRNTEAYLRIRRTLAAFGTKLSFTSFDAGESPEGIFMSTMQAAMAEFDNRQRGLKAQRGMEATKKAGGWTTYAPKGYRCVRRGRLPSLEPNDMALSVRVAFEQVADGLKTIAEAARSIGVAKATDFFRRPVFAGYHEIDGEFIKGSWPAIVPIDVWSRVQERMKRRQNAKHTDFWLRGHLRCECGHMLTASYSQGRKAKYGYYHCFYCHARHPARPLENAFCARLNSLAKEHAQTFTEVKQACIRDLKGALAAAEEAKSVAAMESASIGRKLSSLLDLHLSGGIGRDEYDAKRAELVARRRDIQQNYIQEAVSSDELLDLLDCAAYLLNNMTEFLGKAGFADLMIVVRALVGSITDVSASGELSNREKDGLYWLSSMLTPPENAMATLAAVFSNRKSVSIIVARLKIAREICKSVITPQGAAR